MIKKIKKNYSFPVMIERDEDGIYIGSVPALKTCYTQAKTLPELYKRLNEVVALCISVDKDFFDSTAKQNEFVGVQNLQFSI